MGWQKKLVESVEIDPERSTPGAKFRIAAVPYQIAVCYSLKAPDAPTPRLIMTSQFNGRIIP
jgi:hypothetical protein